MQKTYREFVSKDFITEDFRSKKRKGFGVEYHKIKRALDKLQLSRKQEKVFVSLVNLLVLQFEYLAGKSITR